MQRLWTPDVARARLEWLAHHRAAAALWLGRMTIFGLALWLMGRRHHG